MSLRVQVGQKRSSNWFIQTLKDNDMFCLTIMPTYNTIIGGCASLMIMCMMLYSTVTILKSVFEYSEIKFNKSTEKLTLINEDEIHNFTGSNGIKFAIGWETVDGEPIGPEVGEIYLFQEYWDITQPNIDEIQKADEVRLEPCSLSNFSNGLLSDAIHINQAVYCPPDDFEFTLQSNIYSKQFRDVRIYIAT